MPAKSSAARLPVEARKLRTLRLDIYAPHVTLDPGKARWSHDASVIEGLFSGLAQLNGEMDITPELARSWQVLEGGRRYVFHLRSDRHWSDGALVTAADFEWAWKRNLHPATRSETAPFLFDIVGARDFYHGENPNPADVRVKALDPQTLEVQLVEPVAFFPYITGLPVSFPLPRAAVERYGDAWWQPGKIISNGPFRLVEFDLQHGGILERAENYLGLIQGNVGRVEWKVIVDREERIREYLENRVDITMLTLSEIPDAIPEQEIIYNQELAVVYLVFPPLTTPLDNLSVRKALAHTLDRQGLYEKCRLPVALGGLVPPGMPGHSPEIGLPYDPELGRRLLAEAGYPAGRGFPKLTIITPIVVAEYAAELKRSWRENLGIEFNIIEKEPGGLDDWEQVRTARPMMINGWIADYPDPDNFLRQSDIITRLNHLGWRDADYDRLVEEAARTSNRTRRMAMYRQADRWLVQEQALVLPILYGSKQAVNLVKPWVKSRDPKLFGRVLLKDFIIDGH